MPDRQGMPECVTCVELVCVSKGKNFVAGMTVTRSALGACICETADPEYYSMLTRHSSASAAAFNAQMALDRLALPRAPAPSRAAQ